MGKESDDPRNQIPAENTCTIYGVVKEEIRPWDKKRVRVISDEQMVCTIYFKIDFCLLELC